MQRLTINNALLATAMLFAAASPAMAEGDLTPTIGSPQRLLPGQEVMVFLTVENKGDTSVPGTDAGARNYMVDVVLSSDDEVAPGYSIYSAAWHEDVLLRGGRMSRTPTLAPDQHHFFGASTGNEVPMTLPSGMPPGDYFLCGVADPANRVIESNEHNNAACHPVTIATLRLPALPARALPKPILRTKPIKPSDLQPRRISRPAKVQSDKKP